MENFNDLAKKYKNYANRVAFLGVEDFIKKEDFNLTLKKSFNYSYQEIINKRDFPSISNLIKFLESYEKKSANKKNKEIYDSLYLELVNNLERVKEINAIKSHNDSKIYKIAENISVYKETLKYLEKSNNEYKEKRIQALQDKIKDGNKEIRKIKREISILGKENKTYTEKVDLLKAAYVEFDKTQDVKPTKADLYVKSLDKNLITKFLTNKTVSFTKWELSKAQKFEEILFFEDDSIAIKDKETYKAIKPIDDNYNKLAQEVFKNVISYILRKKPNYIGKMNELMSLDSFNLERTVLVCNNFLNNEQILKNKGFNLLDELNENLQSKKPSLENLDDKMNKIILDYKVNKLANSILSQKYKHLYDKKTEECFKELYDLNADENLIQNIIGKKIASFKTSKDLNNALNLFINTLNNFDIENIKIKANGLNCVLCFESEDSLVYRIKDFNTSKKLGSSSWCISRNESYFESYSGPDNNQYFYFDFSKSSKSDLSMIGFTIRKNGEFSTAHIKNDDYINFEDKYKKIYMQTIINDIDNYNLSKNKMKELGIEEKIKNKQQKIGV